MNLLMNKSSSRTIENVGKENICHNLAIQTARRNNEGFPAIQTKEPTTITPLRLHEQIDRLIEQESPRGNLPIVYSLPLNEAKQKGVRQASTVSLKLPTVTFQNIMQTPKWET
ncbi:hypothetical protein KIN20_021753 [Parelaphostrongylus tenuis]|uniref:Uncharacterized protein n=1 Tax=Parelaphostrongylus tenuis TaxID=148309 RepID=A0AAD5MP93_PARTN|nr:hypothetical protein KIN20_021753 [Parelaphostrongylus tenuis]